MRAIATMARPTCLIAAFWLIGSLCLVAQSRPPQVRITAPDANARARAADQITFDKHISPVLMKYCAGCHGGKTPSADLRLNFANEKEARTIATTERDFWSRVVTEVSTKQMPPPGVRIRPTDEERALLLKWIDDNVMTANGRPDPGPFMVHRLNNRQYANTLRDLLYLPAD